MENRSTGLILGGLLAALLAGGAFVYFAMHGRAREEGLTILGQARPSAALAQPKPALAPPEQVAIETVVHVVGAVKKPGVYRIKPGTRVNEAVAEAGGATAEANLDAVNLAAPVEDGTQLHIPTKKESSATQAPDSGSKSYVKSVAASADHRASARSAKFSQPGKESLNLNTASEAELQRLPGVGPAMAAKIIQHRKENGPFSDPEQLQDVSGIGPKKYEKMRPFVKVR